MWITHFTIMRDRLFSKELKGKSWYWRLKSRSSYVQPIILLSHNGGTSSGITKREFTFLTLSPN